MNMREFRAEDRSARSALRWQMSKFAPIAIKRAFVAKNYDEAMRMLTVAVKQGEPWALRCWLEAAGAIGSMQVVVNNFFQQLNVKDESELNELVELGRSVKRNSNDATRTPAQYFDDALELMLACLPRLGPEYAERAISAIGRVNGVPQLERGKLLAQANGHGSTNGKA